MGSVVWDMKGIQAEYLLDKCNIYLVIFTWSREAFEKWYYAGEMGETANVLIVEIKW